MRVIALFFFVVAASSAIASQDQKSLVAKDVGKSRSDQRGTEKSPLVVKTLVTPKSPEEIKREADDRQKKEKDEREAKFLSYLQALGSAIAALVAAISAFFAGKAAIAARNSAQATRDNVETLKENAVRELRAYVSFKPDTNRQTPDLNEVNKSGIHFLVQNFGKTPAYDVWHTIYIGAFDNENEVPDPALPNEGSNFILNPTEWSSVSIKRDQPITADEWMQFSTGVKGLYVWGMVRYRDAFQQPRWSKFRMRFMRHYLVWCQKGNEAT